MQPLPTLETDRLILRPIELSDAPAMQAVFPQWEVVRYLNDRLPWPYPEDGSLRFLCDVMLPGIEAGTQWHWSLRLKQRPERLIGVISLLDDEGDNRGFWLDPASQGQGLMQEACEATSAYWFDVLQKPLMQVSKAAGNLPSRRVSQRGGMRLIATGERSYVSGRHPSETWEITREEWLSR
ncbi:GNAT family N-acetyltransferase [Pseudomonas sp. LRF_L74]|uniref:GNAT family N-acetyltransferase n=1 Tax=Pseudomonas sp. LRF_L74 TaxID=3369422 RepID=UPI003F62B180